MPSGFRQRHDLMFEFARELKTLPDLANATANDYKRYVRQWHETVEIRQPVGLCREFQCAADPENHFFLSARTGAICWRRVGHRCLDTCGYCDSMKSSN